MDSPKADAPLFTSRGTTLALRESKLARGSPRSSALRARTNKFLKRLDAKSGFGQSRHQLRGRRTHNGIRYTKGGKQLHTDGHPWTMKDTIAQYRKDLEGGQIRIDMLKQEDEALVKTSYEASSLLVTARGVHWGLKESIRKIKKDIPLEKEKRDELERSLKILRHEVAAANGLDEIEKERYHQKMSETKATEARLCREFKEHQAAYDMAEKLMDAEIDALIRELPPEPPSEELRKMWKEDIYQMKMSLKKAKRYTLADAVQAAFTASKEEKEKLHNIAAHCQKELIKTKQISEQLEAEQNILEEEIKAAEERNEKASLIRKDVPPHIPLNARKLARAAVDKTRAVSVLKTSVASLTAKYNAATDAADTLEKQIEAERASHVAAQRTLNAKMGEEIKALKTYMMVLKRKASDNQTKVISETK